LTVRRFLQQGGWIVIPSLVVTAVVAWYQLTLVRESMDAPRRGDGKTVASYGYRLSPSLVDTAVIAASGLPRDGVPPLDFPDLISVDDIDEVKLPNARGKYLVSRDRVVGVSVNGVARAYPVRILAWHEVVNDTLGGVPILVSYSPYADAAVVLDRRVADETTPRRFGFSGLVLNAHHLIYDAHADPERESLWSPLDARAVAGPAAGMGLELRIVPFALTHLVEWTSRHPASTVLDPDFGMLQQYRSEPYQNYFGHDLLPDHPVAPALPPHPDGLRARKVPQLAISYQGTRMVALVPWLLDHADAAGMVTLPWPDAASVRVLVREDPLVAWLAPIAPSSPGQPDRSPPVAIPSFRFAWYALHPHDPVIGETSP
jgi:hypothetical protein